MRWIKYFLLLLVLSGLVFVGIMNTYDDKKNFVIEKEMPYPSDKLFPQFTNFQNFVRWNHPFSSDTKYTFTYFLPYEGQGSSMKYFNAQKSNDFGEIFIRYINPNKTIKYEIYENGHDTPYKIAVKFIPLGEKTKLIWVIETPEIPLFQRFMEWISQEEIETKVEESIKNLNKTLSGKVEKYALQGQIKYDSIMIEEREEQLLLGLHSQSINKNLFKNININHYKLINFISKDLTKKEDEFGLPILISPTHELKNKEISYFYGMPLSQQEKISDPNFIFKKVNKSLVYSIFYKGKYEQRVSAITKILNQIKKDNLHNDTIEELFLESPQEGQDVFLKISLPTTSPANSFP